MLWLRLFPADMARYTFHPAMGPVSDPVSPVPRVLSLQPAGSDAHQYVELIGEDFLPNITVWFADVPTETLYR